MKTEKFKVGDEVELREGLVVGERYGSITLSKYMCINAGDIVEKCEVGDCLIKDWWYSEDMLMLKTPSK